MKNNKLTPTESTPNYDNNKMKENDGRAARRKLNRQLLIVFSTCALSVVIVALLGGFSSTGSGGGSNVSQKLRKASEDYIVGKMTDPLNRRRYRRRPSPNAIDGEEDEEGEGGDYADKALIMAKVLKAELHLVDLSIKEDEVLRSPSNSYSGVYGIFCELDFSKHKEDPSSVPMFRDLVAASKDCTRKRHKLDLRKVAQLARRQDEQLMNDPTRGDVPKVLNLTGVVFHESRCGSTLVANSLIGMNPTKHRTYSESTPPATAIHGVCGETYSLCTVDQAAMILRDTMYLMSRSNDPKEERVFFKFQSVTTRNLPVFLKAWPQVPWIFVYRDPVQVMMSHVRDGVDHANCVRGRFRAPSIVKQIVKKYAGRTPKLDVSTMPGEYYCAAHLASITESAMSALEDEKHSGKQRGIPVVYDSLPNILYEKILPDYWGVPVTSTEIENIQRVSEKYAKGRGNRAHKFESDSERKEQEASKAVKDAADLFLKPSFDMLSNYQY